MEPDNSDIRSQVDASRGLLKKIQLHIPGFKGYRQLEDLRVADELLRNQVSRMLQISLTNLGNARSAMTSSGNFQFLTMISPAISQLQQFQGELLHSEQGYSGISPSIRIGQDNLSELYQYDYAFLQKASDLGNLSNMDTLAQSADATSIQGKIIEIKNTVAALKNSWEKRLITVENIIQSTGGSS